MAQKRMFDRAIIETDNFLNISISAKALYFLLGMEADDEGFVSPNRVLRLYGGEMGDIKNLIDTGLIIPFKSGVVVITDWNKNNWLDTRRIRPTEYQKEKKQLVLTENKEYVLSEGLAHAKPEERRGEEKSIEEKSSNGDVASIIKAFESIDAKNKMYYGNTTQRKAVEFMVKTYTHPVVLHVIEEVLPLTNLRPRFEFPHISTPNQLMEHWVKVKDGLKSKRNTAQTLKDNVAF